MTYSEKLKNPKWQRKRLEIMQRDGFKCSFCHSDKKELNVHHLYYTPGLDPWEYDSESMVTLCFDCHDSTHTSLAKCAAIISYNVLRKRKSLIEIEEAINSIS